MRRFIFCIFLFLAILAFLMLLTWDAEAGSDRSFGDQMAVHAALPAVAAFSGVYALDNLLDNNGHHGCNMFISGSALVVASVVHNQHRDASGIHHYEAGDILMNTAFIAAGLIGAHLCHEKRWLPYFDYKTKSERGIAIGVRARL